MRGVWIEMLDDIRHQNHPASLPMRGVWIEIKVIPPKLPNKFVTPHAGSVD